MATNFESIVGGIFRGLTKNNLVNPQALGMNRNIPERVPLVSQWIGRETNDLRQPIEKEQTQNPALPWYSRSSGTQVSYSQPVPTDIPTRIAESIPQPNSNVTLEPSSIGSLVQPMPKEVPLRNWQFNGYEMSPTNGEHFKTFFANQINYINGYASPTPANVLSAVTYQQNLITDGSPDVWESHNRMIKGVEKGYTPYTSFRGY